jgi:5-carboxymethyl-2-hydroxymuconate isomerase
MPHLTVEYTSNLRPHARIPVLLKALNDCLIAQRGVFPVGGIRSRAIELTDYCIADGAGDYAFVHATLKIGSGRTDAEKKQACEQLFELIKAHFAVEYAQRLLALSMELYEFDEGGTYKSNNLHAHFRSRSAS